MKVIIAGSRSIKKYALVEKAVKDSKFKITEVVCGGAGGVDQLGKHWAKEHTIPVKVMNANWAEYGNGAGPIRNAKMAKYADALIAVWDGKSPGTKDMVAKAKAAKLKVFVLEV